MWFLLLGLGWQLTALEATKLGEVPCVLKVLTDDQLESFNSSSFSHYTN